jgi:hypothetical protein
MRRTPPLFGARDCSALHIPCPRSMHAGRGPITCVHVTFICVWRRWYLPTPSHLQRIYHSLLTRNLCDLGTLTHRQSSYAHADQLSKSIGKSSLTQFLLEGSRQLTYIPRTDALADPTYPPSLTSC